MNKEPIRILHITEMLSAAGIESFLMNVYRKIDKMKVQFDFLVLRNEHEFYEDEVHLLGGNKYWIESDKKNTLFRILEEGEKIYQFVLEHHYNIVHIHYTTPLRGLYLKKLREAGVSVRIYHAHSAFVSGKNIFKLYVYSFMRKKITHDATDYFACSKAAGRWIFEGRINDKGIVKVINNGIDVDRFTFNEERRMAIRSELNIENKYVLINTGRFTEQKNQMFLIDVFNEVYKKEKNSRLLLLGDGPLIECVKNRIKELELDKVVFILGVKNNVQDYLFASDCFVMPSLYEGLPVSGIEAQCTGLPCVFSENITREVGLMDSVEYIDLKSPLSTWCKHILKYEGYRKSNAHEEVQNAGYDITDVANILQTFYLEHTMESGRR